MKIEIKDTIVLSDSNSYVVVSKTDYKDSTYYYLIDRDNNENIKFCAEKPENNSLIEIHDANLIQQLLPLFLKSTSGALTKEDLEFMEGQ